MPSLRSGVSHDPNHPSSSELHQPPLSDTTSVVPPTNTQSSAIDPNTQSGNTQTTPPSNPTTTSQTHTASGNAGPDSINITAPSDVSSEIIQQLLRRITQLESANTRAVRHSESPDPEDTTTVKSPQDVKINKPATFEGESQYVSTFLTQTEMYTSLMSRSFIDDESKVLFAGSFLRGDASRWWTAEYSKQPRPEWFYDWYAFAHEIERVFGRINKQADAIRRMETLRQTKSASDYYTKFLTYQVDAGLGDIADCVMFKRGLRPEILDSLAMLPEEPTTLPELAEVVIRLDQRRYERRLEKGTTPMMSRDDRPDRPSRTPARAHTQPPRPTYNKPSPSPRATPIPLNSYGALTATERQRRIMRNLCLVCGEPGHRRDQCPKGKFNQARGPTISVIHSDSKSARATTIDNSGNEKAPTRTTAHLSRA